MFTVKLWDLVHMSLLLYHFKNWFLIFILRFQFISFFLIRIDVVRLKIISKSKNLIIIRYCRQLKHTAILNQYLQIKKKIVHHLLILCRPITCTWLYHSVLCYLFILLHFVDFIVTTIFILSCQWHILILYT